MTDDGDAQVDATTDAEPAGDDGTPTGNDPARADERPADIEFEDLSLPQRVFVAAVQNPMRGVFVLVLLAFAFSFYVAFWMVFPRVAALLSAIAVAVAAIMAVGYLLLDRLT